MLRRWLVVGACAAAVVTVPSCGSGGPGHAASSAASGAVTPGAVASLVPAGVTLPATAHAALGDLRTLDPCSLVDLAAFASVGAATYGDPQSLDYCVVKVQTAAAQVEVHVGEVVSTGVMTGSGAGSAAGSAGLRADQLLAGGPRVVEGFAGSTTCQDQLVFTDHLAVLATAAPPSGSATAATCTVADAAMRSAVGDVAARRVAHRIYAAHSYGPVDACTALPSTAVLAALPALAGHRAVAGPAGHQCAFGAPGSTSTYTALILAAAYARFDGGASSTAMTAAGHRVVLVPGQPDGRPSECVAYGPHIAFPSGSGQPAIEMAELHVALPDGSAATAACAAATSLARSVFARLP